MNLKIPSYFKSYFWDVNYNDLDPIKDSSFIIKRSLDRGNTDSIKWILNNYNKEDIKNVVLKSRDISAKTANFWGDFFNLNQKDILCLQKPYSPTQFGLSS